MKNRIESTESELNERSENMVKRLFYHRTINKLKADIDAGKLTEDRIEQELADLEAAAAETEGLASDRGSLDTAKQKLDKFYGEADETWKNYEEDRTEGNVGNVMRQRGTFLVHAFQNPIFSPSDENGLIRKEIKWRDKLDLLMALEPSISASAVDEKHHGTFAPVGVLLGEGQIIAAAAHDMGTKAAADRSRPISRYVQEVPVRKQVEDALETNDNKPSTGWNEFVVNEPKVAGVFFRVDPSGKLADLEIGSDTNIAEVVAAAQERNLPLFALRDGTFHHIEPDEALALGTPTETITKERVGLNEYSRKAVEYPQLAKDKEKVAAASVAELPHGATPEMRGAIVERFMSNSPFQLHRFPEALQVESRAEGRTWYRLLNASAENQSEQKTAIPAGVAGNVDPIEIKVLSTIPGPTSLDHVVEFDDGSRAIWQESRNPVGEKSRFRAGSTYHQDRIIDSRASFFLGGFYVQRDQPKSPSELIAVAKDQMDKQTEWLKKFKDDNNTQGVSFTESYMARLAAFIHGVGEEAKLAGDVETANAAEQAAAQVLSSDQYQDLIQRRVSENGTFKLTREELVGDAK